MTAILRPVRPAGADVPHRIDRFVVMLAAAVTLPLLIAAVYVLVHFGGSYHANDDNALNEIVVRQLGQRLVLLGPYSRGVWSHPGPLFYYLMWIPYRIFGSTSGALMVGAIVMNGLAVFASIVIAHRWGGRPFAIGVGLGFAWLFVRLPSGLLWNPWNPFVTILPFALFILCMWAAINGDRFALPLGGAIGTFCVQTHILYGGLVAVCLVYTVVLVVVHRRLPAPDGQPRGMRPLVWLGIVGLVLWAPPAIEQLIQTPGNLRNTFRYLTNGGATKSLVDGMRATFAQFTLRPDWIVGLRPVMAITREPTALGATQVPWLLLPYATALILLGRRGRSPVRSLLLLLGVVVIASIPILARTVGPMYEYRLRWLWVVAMLVVVATVWGLGLVSAARLPRAVTVGAPLTAAVAGCVLVLLGISTLLAADPPGYQESKTVDRLASQIRHHVSPRGPIELTGTSFAASLDIPGIILRLGRAGYQPRVAALPENRLRYGPDSLTAGTPARRLTILSDDEIDSRGPTLPGDQVAFVSSLSAQERMRARIEIASLIRPGITPKPAALRKAQGLQAALAGRAAFLTETPAVLPDGGVVTARTPRHRALFLGDGLGVEASDLMMMDVGAHHGWGVRVRARGLLAPCDWLKGFPRELRTARPAVVGLLSAGDSAATKCMMSSAGGVPLGSPEYYRRYRDALVGIFDEATSAGARVVYFEPPPFADPAREAAARRVAAIVRSLLPQHPGVMVSTAVRDALSDHGRYSETLPCSSTEVHQHRCGPSGRISVRTRPGLLDSGLHLCPAGLVPNAPIVCPVYSGGAVRYARAVADAMVAATK